MDLAIHRPHRQDVSDVIAKDLMVRIGPSAVHVLEMVRAIVEGDRVVPQVDPGHLNEGRHDLSLRVCNRARRRERPLVRDPAGLRTGPVAAVVERLGRVRGPQDLVEGHIDWIAGILMGIHDRGDPLEDVGTVDCQDDQHQDDRDGRDPLAAVGRTSRRRRRRIVLVVLVDSLEARFGLWPEAVLSPAPISLRSHRTGRPAELRQTANSLPVPLRRRDSIPPKRG